MQSKLVSRSLDTSGHSVSYPVPHGRTCRHAVHAGVKCGEYGFRSEGSGFSPRLQRCVLMWHQVFSNKTLKTAALYLFQGGKVARMCCCYLICVKGQNYASKEVLNSVVALRSKDKTMLAKRFSQQCGCTEVAQRRTPTKVLHGVCLFVWTPVCGFPLGI